MTPTRARELTPQALAEALGIHTPTQEQARVIAHRLSPLLVVAGAGSGKVTITIQEKFCEYTAITAAAEALKTGSYVRVVSVSDGGVLLVEPLTGAKKEQN